MKLSVQLLPGVALSIALAVVAFLLARYLGGSALLYALLTGIALHGFMTRTTLTTGIEFSSNTVLKFGVALLGARISADEVLALGMTPVVIVLVSIPATILFGIVLARVLGMSKSQGVLSGGGVAICGASAAIAIAAVLPQRKETERQLVFTIVGVTALSTLAMIFYPLLVSMLNLSAVQQGLFLGATIHNVPQAVGAGFTLSETTGDSATFIKLLRVALLAPVVLIVSVAVARKGHVTNGGAAIPGFLVAFVALAVINSLGWIPADFVSLLDSLSHACLLVAIAAIGLKASVGELAELGWRPMLLITLETVFLAGLVLAGLILLN